MSYRILWWISKIKNFISNKIALSFERVHKKGPLPRRTRVRGQWQRMLFALIAQLRKFYMLTQVACIVSRYGDPFWTEEAFQHVRFPAVFLVAGLSIGTHDAIQKDLTIEALLLNSCPWDSFRLAYPWGRSTDPWKPSKANPRRTSEDFLHNDVGTLSGVKSHQLLSFRASVPLSNVS